MINISRKDLEAIVLQHINHSSYVQEHMDCYTHMYYISDIDPLKNKEISKTHIFMWKDKVISARNTKYWTRRSALCISAVIKHLLEECPWEILDHSDEAYYQELLFLFCRSIK